MRVYTFNPRVKITSKAWQTDTHIHCPNTVGGETAGASRAHDLPTRPLTTPVQCLYPHFKEVDGIGTSTMTDRQASSYTVIQPAIFGGQ